MFVSFNSRKKQILHYLKANVKVSVTIIREYVTHRYQQYETMSNVLGSPIRAMEPQLPSRPPVDVIASAAAMEEDEGAGGGGDKGGAEEQGEEEYDDEEYDEEYDDEEYEDEGQYEDEPEEKAETKLKEHERDEVSRPIDKTNHGTPPICLFCQKKGMTADHWMSDCKKVKTSSKTEIQQMGFCSLCLYLKQPYSQHWCKEYFGRNKLFCEKCVVHVSMCNSPSTHEKPACRILWLKKVMRTQKKRNYLF